MFKSLMKSVFGDPNQKEIKKLTPLVEAINQLEPEMAALSDDEIRQMIERLQNGADEAIHTIQTSQQKAAQGNELTVQTRSALGSIQELVLSTHQHNDRIANAMNEYGGFIQEMQQTISMLDQLAEDVVTNTEKAREASEELSGMSQELTTIVSAFHLQ